MKNRRLLAGFTLLELMMVIVIMGIISVVVARIFSNFFQDFVTSQNISETDWRGLLVMNEFTNDVHNIRSANDISTISASGFSFVDMSGTSVTYSLSGSVLLRNSNTLANGVTGLTFAYFDNNYASTAAVANVRYITISTTLTQNNLNQVFSTMAGTRGMP